MIVKPVAAALLLILAQSSEAPDPGAINFTMEQDWAGFHDEMRFRIDPDGKMLFETVHRDTASPDAKPERISVTRDTGFTGYRRIAALLAPVRRWKGQVPCGTPRVDSGSLALPPLDTVARLRWDADGVEVRLPLACGDGLALNEIELVRAAFDQVRSWAQENDGVAENSVYETVVPEKED